MKSKLAIDFVNRTLNEGDYGYTLRNYLKIDTLDYLLLDNMDGITFLHMTDFNYGRCFAYMFMEDIQLSKSFFTVKAREEVIQRGYIEFISLKISAISPFFYMDKAMYIPEEGKLRIVLLDQFKNEKLEEKFSNILLNLDEKFDRVDPDDLRIPLEGVRLENVEPEDVTIGRYLFE
ncbi:hypothetical protein I6N96_09920 [Enterococcus sp. BWM-S5]|uniref:Uncharacterized protein n=2 Tax=Enterococcus larvae TaxID=2794352 RepID=A0ABS4CJ16_9ENTE|nr:hypothetical protein [Enterococcus larvae]MBP1046604.1 hypothetical protein [Enterococcus larvae]